MTRQLTPAERNQLEMLVDNSSFATVLDGLATIAAIKSDFCAPGSPMKKELAKLSNLLHDDVVETKLAEFLKREPEVQKTANDYFRIVCRNGMLDNFDVV